MPHALDTSRIRAISIDLDDTLWPVGPVIHRAETALQDWLQGRAPRTAAYLKDPEARLALRRGFVQARPDLAHDLRAVRCGIISQALAFNEEDTDLVGGAYQAFIDARMQVELFHDALRALDWLCARYPVVAVSNGNADVHRVGLGRYFRAAFSAQEFGVAKPDPRIFQAAAQAAGVLPREVLHIGDDAALDVVAALQADMQAAWVNREGRAWAHEEHRPHLQVADLDALVQALAGRQEPPGDLTAPAPG